MANLAQYLFQRAQANPESIAIIDKTIKTNEPERPPQMALHGYGAAELRFSEFAARIKRLAGGLTALAQTSHGDRVVICMENRPEFFDLLFACWTAGLCPVPVNAKLHPKEVVHILRDCDARLAFLSGRLALDMTAALADSRHKVAVFATNQASFAALYEGASMEPATVDPTELAWIFYTSGTTGRPKGAMLTHRNLLFMSLVYYADIEQVNPGDVKLHAAPLSHGSGLYALPHLFGGGTQMILGGFDPVEVLDVFEHAQNVTLFAAPTMVTRLMGQARKGA
ncbi:MAG: AMP-binding protein, partial [Burkholderiaceae bacterium]